MVIQMKKIMLIMFFITAFTGFSHSQALSQLTPPIEGTVKYADSINDVMVIVAIEDEVVIEDIILNRGNMKFIFESQRKKLPKTLKFGERFSFGVPKNLREAQVITKSHGSWIMKFN